MTYTQDIIGFWQRIRDIANTGNASMAAYGSDIFEILKSLRDLLNTSHLSTAAYTVDELGMLQNIRDLLNTGNLSTAAYSADVLGVTKNIRDLLNSGSASTGSYPAGYFGILQAALDFAILNGVGGGGVESTVLIDAVGTATLPHSDPSVTFFNTPADHNADVGSGSNGTSDLCLIVTLLFGQANGGSSTNPSVIWDPGEFTTNQAMTQIPGAFVQNGSSGGDTYMFYLMNPTLGQKQIGVTWTGANQVAVASASFANVDQAGGATTFPTVLTSTASGKTIDITTTPTTRKLVGGFNSASNFTAAVDNDIGHDNTGSTFAVAAEYAPGTNTKVSYGGGGAGCSLAVVIKGMNGVGGASVQIDALGTEKYQLSSNNFTYTGLTISPGLTNPGLIVVLTRADGSNDVTAGVAASWGAQSMTLLSSADNTVSNGFTKGAYIFGLRNPTSGNQTLTISGTNSARDNFVNAISFSNVNQSSDAAAFPNATGGLNIASIDVTSNAGHVAVAAFQSGGSLGTIIGTTIFSDASNGSLVNAAADYVASSGSSTTVGTTAVQTFIAAVDISN